jgi:hypothetical protein
MARRRTRDFPIHTLARTWKLAAAREVMLPSSAWRLLFLPVVLLAFLLVGSPDFPAFERAIQKAFEASASSAPGSTDLRGSKDPRLQAPVRGSEEPQPHKRGILVPLYASFAALQALDAHSTLRALDAGATEANPLLGGIAHKPAALLAVKAAVAASTIYLVEKVRVRNRGAAIALMAALNSVYATLVAHNYRVPR